MNCDSFRQNECLCIIFVFTTPKPLPTQKTRRPNRAMRPPSHPQNHIIPKPAASSRPSKPRHLSRTAQPYRTRPNHVIPTEAMQSHRTRLKPRHLDRSDRQPHRLSRSGETPVFRFCRCLSPSSTPEEDRHFDRSGSRHHREQRSGETRFSTQALPQPKNRCLPT
jgi:hypothetical protein